MNCPVSVVIPVFNKERYLQNIFDCLLNQKLEDFECIIVDDGSTDGSGDLCDKLASSDNRFRVFHIPNSGVSHARNLALSKAIGEYITFIDADDGIPENYLECLYKTITESKADMVICSVTKVWESGKQEKVELLPNGVYEKKDLLSGFAEYQKKTGMYGYCCGKIFSKKLVADNQFDESICLAEDFDFYLNLYAEIGSICFTDETTYLYRQESENSSFTVDDNAIDYRAQLTINVHYKHYLEKENVYSGDNRSIVSQLLSNYVYFTLFYCDIEKLNQIYSDLQTVYKEEQFELHGRNTFEKWILFLFRHNQSLLIKFSLKLYRFARKMVKGR
ncbi:MAG: glycosyltransferase family 2 protein [Acutalibacteraceae bacterium]